MPSGARIVVVAGMLALAGLLLSAGSAAAITPTITEFSVGLTPNRCCYYIAAGPDGNMWFTEPGNPGGIGKINPSTGRITEVATGGVTPGFTANRLPSDIVAGPDGNLWFTENGGSAVAKINPSSAAVTEYQTPSPNSGPYDIVVGPDRNLWFTEANGPGRIARINPNTGTIVEFTGGLTANSAPAGIVLGPDGNLWFTEYNNPGRVGKVDPSTGTITEVATAGTTPGFTANQQPNEMVAGPDGNLWFGDWSIPGRIASVNPATSSVAEFTSGITGGRLGSIARGSDGKLWFTEWANPGAIGRLDPTTGTVSEFTSGLTANRGPYGIALGPDGNMWFAEEGNPGAIGRITTPPAAVTVSATATSATSASVSGTANGHAQATSFHIEYGPVGGVTMTTPERSLGTTTGDVPASATLSGLKPATTYRARVVVANPTGTTGGTFLSFTTAPTPVLASLLVSPHTFLLTGRKVNGRCITWAKQNHARKPCKRPITLRVSYMLNVSATVTFTLIRQAAGRGVNGRCVKPTRKNKRLRKCTQLVAVPGGLVLAGMPGANEFTFNGKMGGHTLATGTYQLTATPSGGNPRTVNFKIAS
jgi:streptogramin lyase